MTEQIAERTGAEGAEERPRCPAGSKSGHPCWREATEQAFSEAPHYEVCAEHYRVIHLGRELDELLCDLDRVGEWIATWDDPTVGETRLQYHAFTMRQKMVEELWSLSIRAKAAELVADQGPEEKPLTLEAAERLADYELRSRALFHAAQMFQDLQAVPEAAFGGEFDRWHTAGALLALEEDVNAEHQRRQREIRPR